MGFVVHKLALGAGFSSSTLIFPAKIFIPPAYRTLSSEGAETKGQSWGAVPRCSSPPSVRNKIRHCIIPEPGSSVGIATGYGLHGPGIEYRWEARFSAPVQTGPGAHPASCTMGTGSFLGVKSGRGVTLTPHPLLVPWSRKSRSIPLLPLWAIQPIQSLPACTKVHFNIYLFTASYCLHVAFFLFNRSHDSNP